jgi:nucleotide-binding universal stress UspA family protein
LFDECWAPPPDEEGIAMRLKDILVHLDDSPRCPVRLELAADLAARHGAHLTGLYVIDLPPPDMFYGFPSAFLDVRRAEDVVDRMRDSASDAAGKLEASFRERLRRDGVEGEWRLVEGVTGEVVALHGRYADMIVLGQTDPRSRAAGPRAVDLPVNALMGCGRPMLVVPFAGDFPVVGQDVLVGWNASAEAARALNDALPILGQARQVTVLSINPRRGIGGDGDVPAADIALHLARHGIRAEAAHTVATDIPEGDALLSYAADIGADLLVTGMYGHSRTREMVFGGVTRSLLSEMTIPVFMAH